MSVIPLRLPPRSAALDEPGVEEGGDGRDQPFPLLVEAVADGRVHAVEAGGQDGNLGLEGFEAARRVVARASGLQAGPGRLARLGEQVRQPRPGPAKYRLAGRLQGLPAQRIEAARQVERVERVSRRSPRLHGRVEEQSGKPETFENRLIRNPLSRQSVVDDRRREAQGDRRAVDMQVLGAVAQPQAIPPTPATKNRRGPRG
jgi:hypothetical protein